MSDCAGTKAVLNRDVEKALQYTCSNTICKWA